MQTVVVSGSEAGGHRFDRLAITESDYASDVKRTNLLPPLVTKPIYKRPHEQRGSLSKSDIDHANKVSRNHLRQRLPQFAKVVLGGGSGHPSTVPVEAMHVAVPR